MFCNFINLENNVCNFRKHSSRHNICNFDGVGDTYEDQRELALAEYSTSSNGSNNNISKNNQLERVQYQNVEMLNFTNKRGFYDPENQTYGNTHNPLNIALFSPTVGRPPRIFTEGLELLRKGKFTPDEAWFPPYILPSVNAKLWKKENCFLNCNDKILCNSIYQQRLLTENQPHLQNQGSIQQHFRPIYHCNAPYVNEAHFQRQQPHTLTQEKNEKFFVNNNDASQYTSCSPVTVNLNQMQKIHKASVGIINEKANQLTSLAKSKALEETKFASITRRSSEKDKIYKNYILWGTYPGCWNQNKNSVVKSNNTKVYSSITCINQYLQKKHNHNAMTQTTPILFLNKMNNNNNNTFNNSRSIAVESKFCNSQQGIKNNLKLTQRCFHRSSSITTNCCSRTTSNISNEGRIDDDMITFSSFQAANNDIAYNNKINKSSTNDKETFIIQHKSGKNHCYNNICLKPFSEDSYYTSTMRFENNNNNNNNKEEKQDHYQFSTNLKINTSENNYPLEFSNKPFLFDTHHHLTSTIPRKNYTELVNPYYCYPYYTPASHYVVCPLHTLNTTIQLKKKETDHVEVQQAHHPIGLLFKRDRHIEAHKLNDCSVKHSFSLSHKTRAVANNNELTSSSRMNHDQTAAHAVRDFEGGTYKQQQLSINCHYDKNETQYKSKLSSYEHSGDIINRKIPELNLVSREINNENKTPSNFFFDHPSPRIPTTARASLLSDQKELVSQNIKYGGMMTERHHYFPHNHSLSPFKPNGWKQFFTLEDQMQHKHRTEMNAHQNLEYKNQNKSTITNAYNQNVPVNRPLTSKGNENLNPTLISTPQLNHNQDKITHSGNMSNTRSDIQTSMTNSNDYSSYSSQLSDLKYKKSVLHHEGIPWSTLLNLVELKFHSVVTKTISTFNNAIQSNPSHRSKRLLNSKIKKKKKSFCKLALYPINNGTFCTVFQGQYQGKPVAIKCPQRHHLDQEPELTRDRALKEWRFLCNVGKHPYILQLVGGVIVSPVEIWLVTEYIPEGDLFAKLYSNSTSNYNNENKIPSMLSNLTPKIRYQTMLQIAIALSHMHSLNPMIVHKDLKTNNILIDKNFNIRICDFGDAEEIYAGESLKTYTAVTWQYAPPEIIMCENPSQPEKYNANEKVDIWSLGCVYLELCGCPTPFWNILKNLSPSCHHLGLRSYIEKATKGKYNFSSDINHKDNNKKHSLFRIQTNLPKYIGNLVEWCLEFYSLGRPSAIQVVDYLKRFEHHILQELQTLKSFSLKEGQAML